LTEYSLIFAKKRENRDKRGNFKSLQKWQKILVAICKWSVFGLSSIASAKEDGSHAQTTISNSSTIFFQPNFAGLLKLPQESIFLLFFIL